MGVEVKSVSVAKVPVLWSLRQALHGAAGQCSVDQLSLFGVCCRKGRGCRIQRGKERTVEEKVGIVEHGKSNCTVRKPQQLSTGRTHI